MRRHKALMNRRNEKRSCIMNAPNKNDDVSKADKIKKLGKIACTIIKICLCTIKTLKKEIQNENQNHHFP
jgi:hypothetical protein